ncbi:SIMPL domain-containing protein [Pseudalkalibacillus hwajinpoensis]|uniref:SIMPL domain-containing protein n=1 Tax=Guptibacillus hwajinpoensis TaxID=208199 RepID=UPI00325A7C04
MNRNDNKSDCICDNTLTVYGSGSVEATPNIATATVGAETTSDSISEAQQKNAEIISQIVSSLIEIGIQSRNIQTLDYRIEEEYRFEDGTKIFVGYKVTHLLNIRIEQVQETGLVLDTAVTAGATTISNIQFQISDPQAYYLKAQRMAIEQANLKASNCAGAFQISLPDVPHQIIEEQSLTPSPRAFAEYSATVIQPGQLRISAQITLVYLLNQ